MAYFAGRLNQDELYLPVDNEGNPIDENGDPLPPGSCEGTPCTVRVGVDDEGQPEYARVQVVDDTTYVSYESNRLPLLAPLQLLGEPGNRLADALEPATRAVVDYGYPYNDPLAAPDEYIPARVIPRPGETATFVSRFTEGVQQGLEALNDDAPAAPGISEWENRPGQADHGSGTDHQAETANDGYQGQSRLHAQTARWRPRPADRADQHGDQGEPGPTHQADGAR